MIRKGFRRSGLKMAGLFVGLLLGAGIWGGCGTADVPPATKDASERIEISIAFWGIQEAFDAYASAGDAIFNDMCEQLNIIIMPIGVTWNDYQEKNKVWAASGMLPDVFVDSISTDNNALYRTWAEKGIIKALPSDMSDYPNLNTVLSMDSMKPLAIDGKHYMLPRCDDITIESTEASGMSRAVMYRRDWATEAGYDSAPDTFDEFVAMLKAVKQIHPEAAGISFNSLSFLSTLALDIFPEYANENAWVYEGVEWMPAFASERVIPYIERMQYLHREGLLDADLMMQKDGDAVAKFTGGYACVMMGGEFNPTRFMEANPEVEKLEDVLGFITPFAAADGNRYVFTNITYWSETYINGEVDDVKLHKILALMDYLYSHEYAILLMNGVKGIDWDTKDGKNLSLLEANETLLSKYPVTNTIGWLGSWWGGFAQSGDKVESSNPAQAAYDRLYNEAYAYVKENGVPAPIDFDIFMLNNSEKQAVSSMGREFSEKVCGLIISDTDARTGWQEIVDELMHRGLDEAIQSVHRQVFGEAS